MRPATQGFQPLEVSLGLIYWLTCLREALRGDCSDRTNGQLGSKLWIAEGLFHSRFRFHCGAEQFFKMSKFLKVSIFNLFKGSNNMFNSKRANLLPYFILTVISVFAGWSALVPSDCLSIRLFRISSAVKKGVLLTK